MYDEISVVKHTSRLGVVFTSPGAIARPASEPAQQDEGRNLGRRSLATHGKCKKIVKLPTPVRPAVENRCKLRVVHAFRGVRRAVGRRPRKTDGASWVILRCHWERARPR